MVKYNIDPRIKTRKIDDLIELPNVVVVNEFNEKSAKQFREDFAKALNTKQEIVPVLIDSYGGQAYSLMSMIDTIKSSPVPVATIATGKAMSCGSMLLTCGASGMRFMAPEATVMVHDVASYIGGKIEELKADARETERLQIKLFTMMARNCGKADNYFLNMMDEYKHADVFLDAEACLRHNIVNHVKIPSFRVDVKTSITFE